MATRAMEKLFDRVNIGEPAVHGGLSVFPLFPLDRSPLRYRLLGAAALEGSAEVSEADPSEIEKRGVAWFNLLSIVNTGANPILVRDADILIGGKQDRKASRTCLVAPHTREHVPVMCVEQGRSSYAGSERFSTSRSSADPELRRMGMIPAADQQSRTWQRVATRRTQSGLADATGSFAELERIPQERVGRLVEALSPVLNACGLVIARKGVIQVVEIHADADACAGAWSSLVRSIAQLPVESGQRARQLSRTEVRRYLREVALGESEPMPGVGLGTQRRLTFKGGVGTSLMVGDSIIQAAVLAA